MKQQRSQFQAIKGVRDILPPESALWNRVEQIARAVFATYNFQEIRLPIFEETELFARSVGADTDIVSKEMYTTFGREGLRAALSRVMPEDQELPQEEEGDPRKDAFGRGLWAALLKVAPEG